MILSDKMTDTLIDTVCKDFTKKNCKPLKTFLEYFEISSEDLIADIKNRIETINEVIHNLFPNALLDNQYVGVYDPSNDVICQFTTKVYCINGNPFIRYINIEDIYKEQAKEYKEYKAGIRAYNDLQESRIQALRKNIRAAVACTANMKDFKANFKKYDEILSNLKAEYKRLNTEDSDNDE